MATGKGGSLVSNILKKSSVMDERLLDESVQKLTKKSSQLKGEVYELLKQNYVEFQSYVDTTVSLEQKVEEVTEEYRRLADKIDNELKGRVLKATERREEIEKKLQETEERIGFVQGLVAIHQGLESARSDIQSERLRSAAGHLNDTSVALGGVGTAGCEAKVYRALKSELSSVTSDLSLKLQEEWSRHINWTPKSVPENPSLDAVLKIRLSVPMKGNAAADAFDEVLESMLALTVVSLWEQRVRAFAKKFLPMILRPLITNPGLKAVRSRAKDVITLKLARNETSENSALGRVAEVYNGLTTILTFVSQVVPECYQQQWMSDVGAEVCSEMSEMIIKHCLGATIPKTPSELESYGEITSQTAKFEATLNSLGLTSGDFHELTDYACNVNTHFSAQKCQDVLVRAREVLKKPIHDTVVATDSDVSRNLAQLQILPTGATSVDPRSDDEKLRLTESSGVDLSALTFSFPTCTISKSVKEYVELLYATLSECCASNSQAVAIQLFYTTRNMVDLFCAILPSHYKAVISEVPRIAAVQHNNCMYLAHHLVTLGYQFHARLPAPLDNDASTFVDMVPFVRQLGEECFLAEMRKQSNAIRDCLKTFGSFANVSSDPKCEQVRKGIRQSLLQVRKLNKIYAEVLPTEIHLKAVGALLNTLVTTIANGVLSLEDIAASDAKELHSTITNLVLKEGATLLPQGETEDKDMLSTYCPQWGKLRELVTVLDASLVDILDLWGSGSGPLAQQFTPGELRGMVKALFRNTERRADVLAKITL